MLLRVIGRLFIAAGLLILAFLGYQLWGTGAVADNYQRGLDVDLDRAIAQAAEGPSETEAPPPLPDLGEGLMRIEISKIDVNWVVVRGVSVEDLKKGPGHYPGTALPGEGGNVVISGHRATYGAPFANLDEVVEGDTVRLTTLSGVFEYRVTETKIVQPTDLSVVTPRPEETLTLITCHPRYSSKLRLIVVGEPVEQEGETEAA